MPGLPHIPEGHFGAAAKADAGIGTEQVDSAKLPLGLVDNPADVRLLADIASECRAIDRGGDGLRAGVIEIGDHDREPSTRAVPETEELHDARL